MAEVAGAFEKTTRDGGGEFYRIRDDAPAWLLPSDFMRDVHDAIDGRFPDDWVYEHTMRVAQSFVDDGIAGSGDADVHETADALVDVYTAALTAWLAGHLGNVALCNEAREEWGGHEDDDLVARIRYGQHYALERIAYAVLEAVDGEVEDRAHKEGQ